MFLQKIKTSEVFEENQFKIAAYTVEVLSSSRIKYNYSFIPLLILNCLKSYVETAWQIVRINFNVNKA